MLSNVTFRGGASASYILHGEDDDRVVVCLLAIGNTVPTADPSDGSKWAVGSQFIKLDATSAEVSLYVNTGTRAAPSFTAGITTKANILALLGNLSHTHVFSGTAGTADVTNAMDVADPTILGTQLYLGIDRGKTVSGIFISENLGAVTSHFQTDAGLKIPVVHNAVEEATLTITQQNAAPPGDALTLGSQVYVEPVSLPNRWGAQLGKLRANSAGSVNGTFATSAPVDSLLIEHFPDDQAQIGIPLNTLRLLAGGTIPALAAIGGVLASDTAPVAAVTSDSGTITWAGGSVVSLEFQTPIPVDFDDTKDAYLMITASKSADANTVDLGISTSWNDGVAVADLVEDIPDTVETNIITIAAADIPANSNRMTCILTPADNAGDSVIIYNIALLYKRRHNLLPVYFDHDHATETSRLQCVNPLAKDIYVRLASGRFLKITHSATAAADGALLRYDHGAAAAELISTLATTTCKTGTQLGFWNIDGIYLGGVYINETTFKFIISNPDGLAETDVPVYTLAGNRMFMVHVEAIVAQALAYFDDDAASANQRILAALGANCSIPIDTTQTPLGKTSTGTNAATILIS